MRKVLDAASMLMFVIIGGLLVFGAFRSDSRTSKITETSQAPCPETKEEKETLKNSTVQIAVSFELEDGRHTGTYTGMGFLVGEYIMTAEHVVGHNDPWKSRTISIYTLPRASADVSMPVSRVLYENSAVDFALLETPDVFWDTHSHAAFSAAVSSDVQFGTEICFFMRPKRSGEFGETIEGSVIRRNPPYGAPAWFGFSIPRTVAERLPGASGGPVFVRTQDGLKTAGIVRLYTGGPDDGRTTKRMQATDVSWAIAEVGTALSIIVR